MLSRPAAQGNQKRHRLGESCAAALYGVLRREPRKSNLIDCNTGLEEAFRRTCQVVTGVEFMHIDPAESSAVPHSLNQRIKVSAPCKEPTHSSARQMGGGNEDPQAPCFPILNKSSGRFVFFGPGAAEAARQAEAQRAPLWLQHGTQNGGPVSD